MPRLPEPRAPLDEFHLDPYTFRELVQHLDERLDAVHRYGGACPTCRDAESPRLPGAAQGVASGAPGRGPRATCSTMSTIDIGYIVSGRGL